LPEPQFGARVATFNPSHIFGASNHGVKGNANPVSSVCTR
jgi:hypothetical protein